MRFLTLIILYTPKSSHQIYIFWPYFWSIWVYRLRRVIDSNKNIIYRPGILLITDTIDNIQIQQTWNFKHHNVRGYISSIHSTNTCFVWGMFTFKRLRDLSYHTMSTYTSFKFIYIVLLCTLFKHCCMWRTDLETVTGNYSTDKQVSWVSAFWSWARELSTFTELHPFMWRLIRQYHWKTHVVTVMNKFCPLVR